MRPTAWGWAESALILPIRVGLGVVFVFAALVKLGLLGQVQAWAAQLGVMPAGTFDTSTLWQVDEFARSIEKFQLIDATTDGRLIVLLAYALPWAELLAGVALILGVTSRGAALLVLGMLGVFTWAIASVMMRGLVIECGCFGKISWPCGTLEDGVTPRPIGWCHVGRNAVLMLASLVVLVRGGGLFGLEAIGGGAGPAKRRVSGVSSDGRDGLFAPVTPR